MAPRVQHTSEVNRKENPRTSLPEPQKLPSTTVPSGIVQPNPQREPKREPNDRTNLQKVRDYLKSAFVPNNLSNWVLAAIGIAGIGFAYRTLRALLRQTKATEVAADAAKKSAEIAELSLKIVERADILLDAVSLVWGQHAEGHDAHVVSRYKNFGRTKASNVVLKLNLVCEGLPDSDLSRIPPISMGAGEDNNASCCAMDVSLRSCN